MGKVTCNKTVKSQHIGIWKVSFFLGSDREKLTTLGARNAFPAFKYLRVHARTSDLNSSFIRREMLFFLLLMRFVAVTRFNFTPDLISSNQVSFLVMLRFSFADNIFG